MARLCFFGVGGLNIVIVGNGIGKSAAGKEESNSEDVGELHLDGVDGLKIEEVGWI